MDIEIVSKKDVSSTYGPLVLKIKLASPLWEKPIETTVKICARLLLNGRIQKMDSILLRWAIEDAVEQGKLPPQFLLKEIK